MDVLGQLPGWTAQPGEGVGGDALGVFRDSEEARASGKGGGRAGGQGPGQAATGLKCSRDGSPLEGGVAPAVTRCAFACDVPLSSRLCARLSPLPHSL